MTAKEWISKMIIKGYMEERKAVKDKAIVRAEALKFIFDLSLAVGIPFNKAQNAIINLGEEIKKSERRTVCHKN